MGQTIFQKKAKVFFLIAVIIIGISLMTGPVFAGFSGDTGGGGGQKVPVGDAEAVRKLKEFEKGEDQNWLEEKMQAVENWLSEASASEALWAAVNAALKTIAYDAGTWLGSGGEGQKPLFVTEGWDAYLLNIADNAVGTFLEELGKSGGFGKFNLCEPNLSIKFKIGLGLVQWKKPKKPSCTFSKMKDNWEEELSKDPSEFLPKLQNVFEPASSDLGAALTVQTGIMAKIKKDTEDKTKDREENDGWLDIRNLAGDRKSPPRHAESKLEQSKRIREQGFAQNTEDAFVDAINVFLNQLALTAFNTLLESLVDNNRSTASYSGNYGGFGAGISDYGADPSTSGITGLKQKFRALVLPDFTVRGDYHILGELTMCPRPTQAGPTNCVINSKFRSAIEKKMTVAQAIDQGYLNRNGMFGFKGDGLEPEYREGFPYRSLVILRKYRILPVGWEVAAQYIKDNDVGTCNLGDMITCYNSDDEFDYQSGSCQQGSWCRDLVDPTWVLKAPFNYCRREGPGPELLTTSVVGKELDSELIIARNENYCADEQTCIKENDDGNCELYGYCTEERRVWDFNAKICESNDNTCQSFRKRDGKTGSFLENTLDYMGCDIGNVGCLGYCTEYDYNTEQFSCSYSAGQKLFLDKEAEVCNSSQEGCREFIRTKPGLGVNIFYNSSFENPTASWNAQCDNNAAYGICSAYVNADIIQQTVPIFNTSTLPLDDEVVTFSLFAKNCGLNGVISLGGDALWANNHSTSSMETDNTWQRFSATHMFLSGSSILFSIENIIDAGGEECRVDGIKIERGYSATEYSDYREKGLVYERVIPDYMGDACYVSNGSNYELRDDRPAECDNFARLCNFDEVGCELYTSVNDNIGIPAKVVADDYCPGACVGYDDYLQTETSFDSTRVEFLIPESARRCNVSAVGCDEFTNLDKVGLRDEGEREGAFGAEEVEYYRELRRCERPNSASCSEFYTWEGSSETGYQLKVFSLWVDTNDPAYPNDPDVTEPDQLFCNALIYLLPATDPQYNPDCREFFNTTGEESYHLYTKTISCSDDCHPFRRTEKNIVKDPMTGADLPNLATCQTYSNFPGTYQDISYQGGQCFLCKSGGVWNNEHDACIYMAIPGQGKSCGASQSGCREYIGDSGNNVRFVLNNDFEGGTQGWEGLGGTTAVNDSEALMVGGESLKVNSAPYTASIELGGMVKENKSYYLRFIAKQDASNSAPASQITTIGFNDGLGAIANFTPQNIVLTNEWQIFEFNLAWLDHEITIDEYLFITADGDFYIDNIRLNEIVDRYYLIRNSWYTPETCFNDIFGQYRGPEFNLGCDEYRDRDDYQHFLHDFTRLCQESAVGCEIMVDTHNYSDYTGQAWNDGGDGVCDVADGQDCVIIGDDNFIYASNDPGKACNASEKGCQFLGQPYYYTSEVIYDKKYITNDPNLYDETLCVEEAERCEEWSSLEEISFFKDPFEQTCEWRKENEGGWDWYKKKIKRCDTDADGVGDGGICIEDENCVASEVCLMEGGFTQCPTTIYKTMGHGGIGNIVDTPNVEVIGPDTFYWTGLCSASDAGCTEYIDPISGFNVNYIFNPNFSDIDGDGTLGDGWVANSQDIDVDPYTLYRMAGNDNGGSMTLTCDDDLYRLDENNAIVGVGSNSYTLILAPIGVTTTSVSALIYSNSNNSCSVTVTNPNGYVELKKVIIEYQLKHLVDKESCNGLVNFEDGCVLFNERGQDGIFKSGLDWDADLTISDGVGIAPITGLPANRNVNTLIKVIPDRICDKWLACRSYVKDSNENNVCFDIGLCNSVDENGNCNNFLLSTPDNRSYPNIVSAEQISNLSGYAKVGHQLAASFEPPNDLYPFASMEQSGEMMILRNGGFEQYDGDNYLIGWYYEGGDWTENVFKAIHDPISAQTLGSCFRRDGQGNCLLYTPEGKSFIKMGTAYSAVSEYFDIIPGQQYTVTAFMQTQSMASGQAIIEVLNGSGGVIGSLTVDAGYPWTFKLRNFDTGLSNQIRLRLNASADASGSIFYDDIRIAPVLGSKDNWFTHQTCRLYPKGDSLSCNYIEESGNMMRGWWGYCLEYDRYPGDRNSCLMWWPVNRIKGDGLLDPGGGYYGKYPLYYCLQIDADFEFVEERRPVHMARSDTWCEHAWFVDLWDFFHADLLTLDGQDWADGQNKCTGCGCGICPTGYTAINADGSGQTYVDCCEEDIYGICWSDEYVMDIDCVPSGGFVANYGGVNWYEYNGDLQRMAGVTTPRAGYVGSWNEADTGVRILKYDNSGSHAAVNIVGLYDVEDFMVDCTDLAKTVSNDGTNRVWSARVYDDSEFVLEPGGLDYTFGTVDPPFGSLITPGGRDSNPYSWPNPAINDYPDSPYGNPYSCIGMKCDSGGQCSYSDTWCMEIYDPALGCVTPTSQPDIETYFGCPSDETCETVNYIATLDGATERLKELFAQTYGTWHWDGSHYVNSGAVDGWGPPGRDPLDPNNGLCNITGVGPRPAFPNSYCSILPTVGNVMVNGVVVNTIMNQNGYANLTFTTEVDENQLPLVMYSVDWGDYEGTVVSGLQILNRTDPAYPNSLFHLYDYWDLRSKYGINQAPAGTNDVYCGAQGAPLYNYAGAANPDGIVCPANNACCAVQPGIRIRDNWSWCNGAANIDDCSYLERFPGWIIVTKN